MWRMILLVAFTVALAYAYAFALTVLIGLSMAVPMPRFWLETIPTQIAATLSWMAIWHTLAVFVASVLPALVISRLYPRRWLIASFAITLALTCLTFLPALIAMFPGASPRLRLIWVFDCLKYLGMLPLLVWIARRLPSNNAFERPLAASSRLRPARPAAQRER
jgi:hypothetical protein